MFNHMYSFSETITFAAENTIESVVLKGFRYELCGVSVYKASGSPTSATLTLGKDGGYIPVYDAVDALMLTRYQPLMHKPRLLKTEIFEKNQPLVFKMYAQAAAVFTVTIFANREGN